MKVEEVSQIVGLWLAEGGLRSKSEITFTNSQPELIQFFHKNLLRTVRPENRPRIYVYRSNENVKTELPVRNVIYRFYIHPLSRRPFFIYRISGVKLVKEWLKIVENVKTNPKNYRPLLQGFFAGEGNIKFLIKTSSRVLRISQGKQNEFIESVFRKLSLPFTYEPSERSYVISGRENLENLWKLGISKLHPIKHKKFEMMLKSYKQRHLKKGQLGEEIIRLLNKPLSTNEISKVFEKSESRVSRVLSQLKKKGLVKTYRVRSLNYWIKKDARVVIISKTKFKILNLLSKPRRVHEISNFLNVSWKSPFRRLKELERLGLVRQENGLWYKKQTNREVIVL